MQQALLILIDEAGQLEWRCFPDEVSTIAALGGMFVTGWQSADPTGRKSISEHQQREDLLPLHLIRQMHRLDADLFHGTLPPIHLRLVRWWKTKELSALVPRGDDGKPLPPPSTGTCPTGEERQSDAEPVIDAAVIADHLASLPRPKTTLDRLGFALSAATKASIKPSDKSQGEFDFARAVAVAVEDDPVDQKRLAGTCKHCGTKVNIGLRVNDLFGGRRVIRCQLACPTKIVN